MYLPNTRHQGDYHPSRRADGTITTGSTPQLVLPVARTRAMLLVMNISASNMFLDHGPPRAVATISGGAVTAVTVLNAGFGYTMAPTIQFGGGFAPYVVNSVWDGRGIADANSPSGLATQGLTTGTTKYNRPAKAHFVLSGGAVSSVVIDDPGFGYVNPPEVIVKNNDLDPFGCAAPSATQGILLANNGGSYYLNGTTCHTESIAIFCTSSTSAYTVEYMG